LADTGSPVNPSGVGIVVLATLLGSSLLLRRRFAR
jgi:hypothetical protein